MTKIAIVMSFSQDILLPEKKKDIPLCSSENQLYREKCLIQPGQLPKNNLLMNSKHTSFPPFDFLQRGRLKFIRLFKLISSAANNLWLIVCNDEGNKQLKFISRTNDKAIYTEKVVSFYRSSEWGNENKYVCSDICNLCNSTCVIMRNLCRKEAMKLF